MASGGLTQKLRPSKRPVGYFSRQLDPVAAGLPACLRAVAATAIILKEAQKITMGYDVIIKVPHEVHTILTQRASQFLTPARTI